MMIAEANARARAHDPADEEMRRAMHRFVVEHFGGCYQRAAWCLNELLLLQAQRPEWLEGE